FIASSSLRADRDHRLAEDGVQIDVAKPGVQQVMGEWGQTDAQVAQLQGTVLDSKRSGIVAEDLAGAESVGDPGAGGREFRRDQDQLAPLDPIRLAPFGALDRMDPREVEPPAADRETTSFDLETGAGPGGGSRRQESSER